MIGSFARYFSKPVFKYVSEIHVKRYPRQWSSHGMVNSVIFVVDVSSLITTAKKVLKNPVKLLKVFFPTTFGKTMLG